MKHIQTQTEWEDEMGHKIIEYIKGELYIEMRFMDVALTALVPYNVSSLMTFATDGKYIYYGAEHLIDVFKINEKFLERAYLHSVLHCIYAHLWLRGNREESIWNLSCDIAVEAVIDHLEKKCTNRAISWTRQQVYEKMNEKGIISASNIYDTLQSENSGFGIEKEVLYREFYTDNHRYWPKMEKSSKSNQLQNKEIQKKWQQRARQMQMQHERGKTESEEGEQIMMAQMKASKSRRSYAEFLKKFAVWREQMHCDADEFDLTYYTYGLEKYGNMPLIEPVETKEEKKILELIIVIDTSYSTSGELVKGFLKETSAILLQEDAFFSKCSIHIIQCDDSVRSDIEITSHADLERIVNTFSIKGGGNTDFRPAFSYVNELKEMGKMDNIGGLLYFTDGQGIYPKKKPDYKTAFLYLNEFDEAKVPPWAMRMQLDEYELRHSW